MSLLKTAYSRTPAMGTFFEAFLCGDDDEQLEAVAAAVLDEVRRLDRLLSRFDPAAEVARVNREAAVRPVRVDADLWGILSRCNHYRLATGGFFDVTASSGVPGTDALVLDADRRTVRFSRPQTFIDLGGFAKGYALDRGAALLRRFQVQGGLLNGGTSSVLAVGRHPNGEPWPIDVRNPFADAASTPVARLPLADQAFSCSSVRSPGQPVSDVIAPHSGEHLTGQAACVVTAPSAAEAEVLSTASLAMGKERACEYLERNARAGCRVGWIDAAAGEPQLCWLQEAP